MSNINKFLLGLLTISGGYVLVNYLLRFSHLDHGAATYLGIPILLGWVVGVMKFEHPISVSFKYTTVCLCIIAPLLGEGAICLLMAAPIVYLLSLLVAYVIYEARQKKHGDKVLSLALLPILIYTVYSTPDLEQVPFEYIEDSVVLEASVEEVWARLDHMTMKADSPLPWFFHLGFPIPQKIESEGNYVGAIRRVVFDNGAIVGKISQVVEGEQMTLDLSYENPGKEFFDRWVLMSQLVLKVEAVGENQTRLSHGVFYKRLLGMEWYFDPIEKYSAEQIQLYWLDCFKAGLVSPRPTAQVL